MPSYSYSQCSDLLDTGAVAQADPDISGPGVITAFIFSAYITLLATLAAYCFGLVDAGLLRPVDRLILHAPSRAVKHPRTHVALRKAVLATSDQQIVTGIAILAAGFHGLQTGSISVYHFQIVVYLAWMSSSVHLSALTLLRPFLYHHRGLFVWRMIGMMVLLIMLIISLVPTVSNDWAILSPDIEHWTPSSNTTFGMPAICFWGQTYGDGVNPDAVLSFLLLFFSYVWKMGGMFTPIRNGWQQDMRRPIDHLLELPLIYLAKRYAQQHRVAILWCYRFYLAIYLTVTAGLEVLDSFSAALWLSILGSIYGTLQILVPRELVQAVTPELQEEESVFGFGQLVPLVLLAQPLGAITENIWLAGRVEELVYQEPEIATNESSVLNIFDEQGTLLQKLKKERLLTFLSTYTSPPWQEDSPARVELKTLLYTSKTFAFLIYGVNMAIAGFSCVVFWLDYQTIGFVTSSNWFFIGVFFGGYVVAAFVIATILIPFSRLSRPPERQHDSQDISANRSWPTADITLEALSDKSD